MADGTFQRRSYCLQQVRRPSTQRRQYVPRHRALSLHGTTAKNSYLLHQPIAHYLTWTHSESPLPRTLLALPVPLLQTERARPSFLLTLLNQSPYACLAVSIAHSLLSFNLSWHCITYLPIICACIALPMFRIVCTLDLPGKTWLTCGHSLCTLTSSISTSLVSRNLHSTRRTKGTRSCHVTASRLDKRRDHQQIFSSLSVRVHRLLTFTPRTTGRDALLVEESKPLCLTSKMRTFNMNGRRNASGYGAPTTLLGRPLIRM